jgi:hypothetical protein
MRIGELVIKSSPGQKKKKLPKRTGNRKARKAAAWVRGEIRKQQRREAQEAAHARNVARGYSEWDLAKAKRANNRKS